MASFWRQRLLDKDDELDDDEDTLPMQNIDNFDMTDEQNGQHVSKRVTCHKCVTGEGVRINGQFEFEKRIFELEEQLEHLKEENKILKNKLKQSQMRQINIQPSRETDESYVGQRFTGLTDLGPFRQSTQEICQNNVHFQQKLEERFMELEKRLDKLENRESHYQYSKQEENLEFEKSFNVGEPESRFLHLCCENRIKSILESVDVTELILTETKVSIRFKGSNSETLLVLRNLQDLKNNVLSKTWNLFDDFKNHEIFLIANSLKIGQMKNKLETYKYREKTLVIPTFSDFTTQHHSALRIQKIRDMPKNSSPFKLPAHPVAKVVSEDESDSSESSEDTLSYMIDTKYSSHLHFTIITLHGNKTFEAMKKIITQDIREECLHVDYFRQNVMKHWPRESRQKILKEAMKLSVWVERLIHPKTKHVGFQLIGEKPAIAKIKAFIQQEFHEESGHLPKRSLTSDNVPRRGTVDFMKYAADSDELFPSYWSLNKSKKFWSNLKNNIYKRENSFLVEIDKETKDAITRLVHQTLDVGLVGQGNDAAGIRYSGLKVLDVKRVENAEMFEPYRVQRKRLFDKMVRKGKICPDIGKLRGSKGRVCTTELLSDSMKKELYYEVNEHYLFHGTKSDTIDALTYNGLDPRLSNEAAMFGNGIYAAERVTKSDQYTDSKQQRTPNGTKMTLILTRMLLGNVFLCDDNHKSVQGKGSKKLTCPPCMFCSEDVLVCRCRDQTLFDSVMGDGKWLFREFVVYMSSQCYPEYVITYTRV